MISKKLGHYKTPYPILTVIKSVALLTLIVLIFSRCNKDSSPPLPDNKLEQYFKGSIDNQSVSISSKDSEDVDYRSLLKAQYSIWGVEEYAVEIKIPKANSSDPFQTLKFTIHDVEFGSFQLNGESTIYNNDGSFLTFREGASNIIFYKSYKSVVPALDSEVVRYIPNPEKKPFVITIDQYDFIVESSIPIVGGKLNGVLYNSQNEQDSIIIKNGAFVLHYLL